MRSYTSTLYKLHLNTMLMKGLTFAVLVVSLLFCPQNCVMLFVKLELEHHRQKLVITDVYTATSCGHSGGCWSIQSVRKSIACEYMYCV